AFVPTEHWKIGAIFSAADAATCVQLSKKWIDFLSKTGNGERTKIEREKWLSEHNAFSAELIELGGKKFDPDNKLDAQRAAEALGLVIDKLETTEDADAKGP